MKITATATAHRAGWISPAPLKPFKSIFHLHNSQLVGSVSRIHIPELRSGDVNIRWHPRKPLKARRRAKSFGDTHLTSSNLELAPIVNSRENSQPCERAAKSDAMARGRSIPQRTQIGWRLLALPCQI